MTLAIFEGTDINDDVNLFVTNGTSSGTTGIAKDGSTVLNQSWGILQYESLFTQSPDFTDFANAIIFAGTDITGTTPDASALWITNGTTGGTYEITGVSGTTALGVIPLDVETDFKVLGNEVLFAGNSSSGIGLWVTNGTAAETRALNITGAYSGGIFNVALSSGGEFSPDFTVLGSIAVFWGADSSGSLGLWVTDGTSPGTNELTGNFSFSGLATPSFTIFGNEALFLANSGDDYNLWTTNGTAAGTIEVAAGPGPEGLFFSHVTGTLLQPDFMVLRNEVLFEGYDANSHVGLWVTNGTAAGTSELSVAGADSNGLFNPSPSGNRVNFSVLGSEALFAGYDSAGHNNLWVTNGTSDGTTELSVAGAYTGGLVADYLTAFGNEVLFVGYDANGDANLWVTDGTSGGTRELSVAGANPSGLFSTVNPDFTVVGDYATFIGIGSNGVSSVWITDGTSAGTSELTVAGASASGLNPADIAAMPNAIASSFYGNGTSDILWRNTSGAVENCNFNSYTIAHRNASALRI
jgi:ELWxxDGT repeat protein